MFMMNFEFSIASLQPPNPTYKEQHAGETKDNGALKNCEQKMKCSEEANNYNTIVLSIDLNATFFTEFTGCKYHTEYMGMEKADSDGIGAESNVSNQTKPI